MKLWVYISGPYTHGDPVVNVRNAVEAAEVVRALGHVPIVPHLYHLWHLISPQAWDYWIELDMELLERCDVLMRLPGASKGADLEWERMEALGKPVDGLITLAPAGIVAAMERLEREVTCAAFWDLALHCWRQPLSCPAAGAHPGGDGAADPMRKAAAVQCWQHRQPAAL